ncbi:MAG: hypothetical protein A3C84_01670 [Candidatus Ryanbacteria bacterium RIFCSPHIGHO2_02_FULL_48_12]|uniref:Minus agglutinin n=1 Tax=Candidatus Ryanbacteria bacterium RIFCSPHIGHO2_01_FULL_48_27 TaxID=1802115 RepID=A0A1G2G7M0_9BACT|nr:MAG: hypothetical protein A2756_06405 [Candidatus Ryanbacteria bacterium RIFCSPHIGHO2_01_FULL_48_27]OGZ49188.1 MAG: hypothetical protein A3C84_01670 [Candidatus Ryanbacteria bacterium RIFCSPHIGHO2_02_FULL_48_12]
MNISHEELLERYEKLPQILKDAIFAEATADKVFNIGKKHGLTIDKLGNLATEIGYVVLGVSKTDELEGKIASIGLGKDTAKKITEDVNKEIFYPIRDHLRGVSSPTTEAPAPSLAPLIFQQKITEVHHEPAQKIAIEPKDTKPTTFDDLRMELKNISTLAGGVSPETKSSAPTPTYKASDPYRELVAKDELQPKSATWNPGLKSSTPTPPQPTPLSVTPSKATTPAPALTTNQAPAKPTLPSFAPLPPIKSPSIAPAPALKPSSAPTPSIPTVESTNKISPFRGYKLDTSPSQGTVNSIPTTKQPIIPPLAPQTPSSAPKPAGSFDELRKTLNTPPTTQKPVTPTAPTPNPAPRPAPTPTTATPSQTPASKPNDPYRETIV